MLPSVWKMIEEPTIGLSIRGCDEETSNIAKGVFTIELGAVVFCGVLGAVGYSMAASLLLRRLIPVIQCVTKLLLPSLKPQV